MSMPDNGELMRRLDDVSTTVKDDLSEIKTSLSALLPREVYDARHTALVLRVERLEAEQAKEAEQRRTLMRWVVGTMIVPVCLFIAQMWINAQGAGV